LRNWIVLSDFNDFALVEKNQEIDRALLRITTEAAMEIAHGAQIGRKNPISMEIANRPSGHLCD